MRFSLYGEFWKANFGQKKSFAEAKDHYMAGAERLELATPGFGDRCSTN